MFRVIFFLVSVNYWCFPEFFILTLIELCPMCQNNQTCLFSKKTALCFICRCLHKIHFVRIRVLCERRCLGSKYKHLQCSPAQTMAVGFVFCSFWLPVALINMLKFYLLLFFVHNFCFLYLAFASLFPFS